MSAPWSKLPGDGPEPRVIAVAISVPGGLALPSYGPRLEPAGYYGLAYRDALGANIAYVTERLAPSPILPDARAGWPGALVESMILRTWVDAHKSQTGPAEVHRRAAISILRPAEPHHPPLGVEAHNPHTVDLLARAIWNEVPQVINFVFPRWPTTESEADALIETQEGPALAASIQFAAYLETLGDQGNAAVWRRYAVEDVTDAKETLRQLELWEVQVPKPWVGLDPTNPPPEPPATAAHSWHAWTGGNTFESPRWLRFLAAALWPKVQRQLDEERRLVFPALPRGTRGYIDFLPRVWSAVDDPGTLRQGHELAPDLAPGWTYSGPLAVDVRRLKGIGHALRKTTAEKLYRYLAVAFWHQVVSRVHDPRMLHFDAGEVGLSAAMGQAGYPLSSKARNALVPILRALEGAQDERGCKLVAEVAVRGRGRHSGLSIVAGSLVLPREAVRLWKRGTPERHLLPVPPWADLSRWGPRTHPELARYQWDILAFMREFAGRYPFEYTALGVPIEGMLGAIPVAEVPQQRRAEALEHWLDDGTWLLPTAPGHFKLTDEQAEAVIQEGAQRADRARADGQRSVAKRSRKRRTPISSRCPQ